MRELTYVVRIVVLDQVETAEACLPDPSLGLVLHKPDLS